MFSSWAIYSFSLCPRRKASDSELWSIIFLLVISNSKARLVNKAQLSRGEVLCLTSLVLAGLVVCSIVLHSAFFRHEGHVGWRATAPLKPVLWQADLLLQWAFNGGSITRRSFYQLVNDNGLQGKPYQDSAAVVPRDQNIPFPLPLCLTFLGYQCFMWL